MIRLLFKPNGLNIDSSVVFQSYVGPQIDHLRAEFAGFITVDAIKYKLEKLEPLWQYIIKDEDITREMVENYLREEPIVGYEVFLEDR